jgi:hypothetical protein
LLGKRKDTEAKESKVSSTSSKKVKSSQSGNETDISSSLEILKSNSYYISTNSLGFAMDNESTIASTAGGADLKWIQIELIRLTENVAGRITLGALLSKYHCDRKKDKPVSISMTMLKHGKCLTITLTIKEIFVIGLTLI